AVRGFARASTIGRGAHPRGLSSLTNLSDHVRQETEEARPLDGARKLTLLFCRYRGDTAWHDLAALGNVALQQLDVLVVDLRRIGAGERTALTPTEKRAACTRT